MVNVVKYPDRREWNDLMRRAATVNDMVRDNVRSIIEDVKRRGDEALLEYSERFDRCCLDSLKVGEKEIEEACRAVPASLKSSMELAISNIAKFHKAQMPDEVVVETMPGVTCRQKAVPISRVGIYAPGGNAPLFSTVLMLAVPAVIAGCEEIVLCTPPGKDGKVDAAILCAAHMAGVNEIYKVGGAQAVAAMAFGTESIKRVNKIFGPGNRYVTEAKQQVGMCGVAIDLPAGPSEVMVLADFSASPQSVAADFLSQAEHGVDSQSILLTDDECLADMLTVIIERYIDLIPKKELAMQSLSKSHVILLHNSEEMMDFANEYAPEHLIINCTEPWSLAKKVKNAGSVFIGPYSPESVGDYASGTNHTLPTGGHAKSLSGVNIDSFVKKITFQELTQDGLKSIASTVMEMAEREGLIAHKLAVEVRIENKINETL